MSKAFIRLRFNTNNSCNLRCKHCFFYKDDDRKNILWERWFNIEFKLVKDFYDRLLGYLNKVYNWDFEIKVSLMGGGEFFLYKYWKDLVEYLVEKRVVFWIVTNGLLIDKKVIEYLNKFRNKIDFISISIEWDKKTTNFLRGKNVFDIVMAKLIYLSKLGFSVRTNLSLWKHNLYFLPVLLKKAKKYNFYVTHSRFIDFSGLFGPRKWWLDIDDYRFLYKVFLFNNKYMPRQEYFFYILRENIEDDEYIYYRYVIREFYNFYILPTGDVYPWRAWVYPIYKLGNIYRDSVKDIFDKFNFLRKKFVEKNEWFCNKCPFSHNCFVWKDYINYLFKNPFKEDYICSYFIKNIVFRLYPKLEKSLKIDKIF